MSKLIYLKSGQDQGAGAVPKDAPDAQREYETRFRDLVEGSLQGIMSVIKTFGTSEPVI